MRSPILWIVGLVLLSAAFATPSYAQPQGAPVLVTPLDQAQIVDTTTAVPLEWGALAGATTYELQLYYSEPVNPGDQPIALKTKVLSDLSQELLVADLIAAIGDPAHPLSDTDSTFHWRVRARNVDGESDWSEVWEFTLVPPGNEQPEWSFVPADTTVDELAPLEFTVEATDPENDPINYFIDSAAEALGMTMDAGGNFSWTPTEEQGPDAYPVTISATDGTLTIDSTITITVFEVNLPPELAVLPDTVRTIDGSLYTLDVDATDPDILAPEPFTFNTLMFSLDAPPDPGMAIDPSTGVFSWTPPAPDTVDVTFRVDDDGDPSLFDTQTVTLVIEQVSCPRLDAVEPLEVNEGDMVQVTLQASNECPAGNFTISIDQASLDLGMTLDDATGVVSWITNELHGPDVYTVTASVTDGVTTNSTDFTVTVNEVNLAPVLETIADVTVQLGEAVSVNAVAADPDTLAPPPYTFNALEYSLGGTPESGMSIDGSTGAFSWTPAAAGAFDVMVVVTDDGIPAMADSLTFAITVIDIPPPPPAVCTLEDAYLFEWDNPSAAEEFVIEVSEDSEFTSTPLITETTNPDPNLPIVGPQSALVDISGLEVGQVYHWRVIARIDGREVIYDPSLFKRLPAQITVQHTLSFLTANKTGDFRMISLPGAASVAIGTTFAGNQAPAGPLLVNGDWDWSVWEDNKVETTYPDYLINPTPATEAFEPGVGYWAISKTAWEVPATTVSSVGLVNDQFFTIPLNVPPQSKWTMIGNPVDYPVSWQEVVETNGLTASAELWDWTGTQYQAVEVLEPYKGYYFFNQDDRANLDISCINPPASAARISEREEPRLAALELSLHKDQAGQEPALSDVTVSWDEEADEGLDAYDRFVPPAYFEAHRVSLINDNLDIGYAYLHHEARPSLEARQSFDLELKAVPHEPVYLRVAGLDVLAGQEVYLFDESLGKSHNLHETPVVLLEADQEISKLRLVIGDTEFIQAEQSKLVPEGFKMQQSYPNPFVDQTTIEFALPDPQFVSLEVYNVLGQRVRTLVHGDQDAGYHRVVWDGRSDAGDEVASGMYLYVLKSPTHNATERLVRVR